MVSVEYCLEVYGKWYKIQKICILQYFGYNTSDFYYQITSLTMKSLKKSPSYSPSFITRLKNRALDAVLFTTFSILFIFGLAYALNYPSTLPAGETTGGKFMSYFNNMFAPANHCQNGQAIDYFNADGTPHCALTGGGSAWPNGNYCIMANGTCPIGFSLATIKNLVGAFAHDACEGAPTSAGTSQCQLAWGGGNQQVYRTTFNFCCK